LSDDVTIFSGELSAIKLSLLWVKHNYEKYDLKRDIAIFSDSLSSLSAIKEEKSACRPKMLEEVLHLINVIPAKVYFVWIQSHLGIKK